MKAILLVPVLLGCGYQWGADKTAARTPDGTLPRVEVRPFDNLTFRRGLEIRLTRLVDDEIRARTRRDPAGGAPADWVLEGSIVGAGEGVLSEDRQDVVRESSFWVTAEVTVKDRATENPIGTYSVTETEPFSPRAGRVRTLEEAQEQSLRDLAERIVYLLEARKPEPTR